MKKFISPIILLLAAIIWGAAFVAQKAAAALAPLTLIAVRSIFAVVFLIPAVIIYDRLTRSGRSLFRVRGGVRLDLTRRELIGGAVCGSFLFIASTLQQAGITETDAGKASFITALYVVIVPLLSLALGKRSGLNVWTSVALAVVGFYLLCITDGFTLETYLYLDMYSTSTIYPIGHMQSGGFGLQIKNGDLQFLVYTGNKAYERASAPMRYGEWVHVIAQYDGKTISLYMNGEKVSEVEATSAEWTLPTAGARYLVIGGDATHQSYVGTSFSRCQISVISLYSTALTDEEIQSRYQALK